jgi:uncharacterized protein with HEPN domain
MQPDRRDVAALWDMLSACSAIESFIAGQSENAVQDNLLLRSAIHWQVIVLGEAARRVSREFRERSPDVDWTLLFAQRNFYAHEYDSTDPIDLWAFATHELPRIAAAIRAQMSNLEIDWGNDSVRE